MGRGHTCEIWPHGMYSQRMNNLNRISTYMSLIFTKPKYSPAPKRNQYAIPHYLSSVLSSATDESGFFQSFWTGASHCTARCQRVLQLFFSFSGDFAVSFSTDSSNGLLRGAHLCRGPWLW
ncbi:hypothetical protein K443DRAFT_444492 [Laccaria amethystina LaAM-08-1]|uniref:Unplaced genomic scaffold K443scaffold_391, whole genome shotgun sequence n=1 Tax=Laccaria amethystina LaAM-08-1 TaxID=1095629 RepID=A0A0C9WUK1_9AGAR|nr:hypothetical protein K443DRAFT_444492 [Laccaria amethystina LaAM-08-1]